MGNEGRQTMRTNLTTEDIKVIIDRLFNGNLAEWKAKRGTIEYENPNSETILTVEEDTGEQTEVDIAQYLNVRFYTWKNRLEEKADTNPVDNSFMSWISSLNLSINDSLALVELVNSEVTPSQDIDSASLTGRITLAVQTNKIHLLEYYLGKIRNSLLGVPMDVQNSYGDIVKAFIHIGIPLYDSEPETIQIGEVLTTTVNFTVNYLTDSLNYKDTKVELSLDGANFEELPYIKGTYQNVFVSSAVTKQDYPALLGYISTSMGQVNTISFYDFNKGITLKLNDLFWSIGAKKIDGVAQESKSVQIPVWLRITSNGKVYEYEDMIDNMQKVITNGDFNISSITLKGNGKTTA